MRRALIAVSLLVSACHQDRLQQVSICGQPCYPGDAGPQLGLCHAGSWYCPEGSDPVCVGAQDPVDEVCDGVDNDCNGRVDDVAENCETVCGHGVRACVNGAWAGCRGPEPRPEVCNGKDDDCDGLIDEPEDLPIEPCYSLGLNAPELRFGECRFGINRCVVGQNVCEGEVLPTQEVCNGKDDNCNGLIDEGMQTDGGTLDLVVVVDNSGSMELKIASIKTATAQWVVKYGTRPWIRFGLVSAPSIDPLNPNPVLEQNLTDPLTFNVAIALQNGSTGTGNEPTLDALADIASPANPLGLTWAQNGSKVVVVYSDEEPQSYRQPQLTLLAVTQALVLAGIKVHVFTSVGTPGWSGIAAATGGLVEDIEAPAADIGTELDLFIQKAGCQ